MCIIHIHAFQLECKYIIYVYTFELYIQSGLGAIFTYKSNVYIQLKCITYIYVYTFLLECIYVCTSICGIHTKWT